MAIKNSFDWSVLDRNKIYLHVMRVTALLTSQTTITPAKFHSIVNKKLKTLAPIRIKKLYNSNVDTGTVYIGGTYYSCYDQENKKSIELQLIYHSPEDQILVKKSKLKRMAFSIADTILHEIMHMRQYRKRGFINLPDYKSKTTQLDLQEEQTYLGCADEIDSYSFNIACELNAKFKGNNKNIIQYLNTAIYDYSFKNSWIMYLEAFEHDHNHPIIKKLKKKIIHYLPAAKIGKPYNTNDWLDC